MLERREFLAAAGCGVAAATMATNSALAAENRDEFALGLAAIERDSGGRLGVAVHDTGTGWRAGQREGERFPLCSTFKFLLAAAVLARVDRGGETLVRPVRVTAKDILGNSPFSKAHAGGSASVGALCEAMVTLSDNTAANLLLPAVGGPAGYTAFARSIGDPATRLDHGEPALGQGVPGDPRDTTTPAAIIGDLQRVLLGNVLKPESRTLLTRWMAGSRTGVGRLRAGLPQGWRIGHKTGTGENGSANDIAIIWPPKRAPILIASYLTETSLKPEASDAIHARVAALLVRQLAAAPVRRGTAMRSLFGTLA